ncbi:MAG: hypothetical protein JHC88_21325, partial [Niveispirillum sp.]|nr:hypothetical protein [Niveispirillum sp.]
MDDYQEALARIEKEATAKTGVLDLGGLPTLSETPREIAGLSHLQSLNLSFSAVSDLSYISSLDNLESLSCVSTELRDLKPLANLRRLREFTCLGTKVRDLGPLSGLKNLEHLVCGETNVNDLTPLENLTNLLLLDCWNTEVYDLTPIRKLINLKHLNVSSTIVQDLNPVRDFDKLVYLNCSFTNVRELSSTLLLKNLKRLDCFECKIVSPPQAILKSLRNLHTFILGGAPIPDIPPNILSKSWDDNCLDRLRAHFDDLEQGGEVDDAHIKLLILGNGRVGKTQITGRLCDPNFTFDEKSVSTHGIVIKEATLPTIDDVPVSLSVWDFGGQDIYHGTHALFLNSPAILALIWDSKTEGKRQDEKMDKWERNYPLLYWLALAQQHGYGNSAIIPVQSQCDDVTAEEWRPDLVAALPALPFPARPFCLSTKTGHGWAGFTERLGAAVAWMRKNGGITKIGAGRERVRAELQAMQKHRRRLPMTEFTALCQRGNDISSPEALLHWLHAQGTVFYREGMFHDQIVLDQQWALDAIYALFDRAKGACTLLQYSYGRFTRDLLAQLVWQDRAVEDQELFISMMLSCGICFQYRMVRVEGAEVAEYIAPDLLPGKDSVATAIERRWLPEQESREEQVRFNVLHGGVIRRILSDIGTMAGDDALYWKGGVLGFEDGHQSRFMIEQKMDTQDGWTGHIHISTQGGDADGLMARLLALVEDASRQAGLKPEERDAGRRHRERDAEMGEPEAPLQMVREPQADRKWYVSYCWGDDTDKGKAREAEVDRLCAAAEANGITIERDKNVMTFGDSISKFMDDLADGDRIFIVMSDAYLKSEACTYELLQTWRNSGKPEKFLSRIRLRVLEGANIWKQEGRAAYADHWHDRSVPLDYRLKKRGSDAMGAREYRNLKHMRACAIELDEILSTLADRVQ